jgi:hypothetical protein
MHMEEARAVRIAADLARVWGDMALTRAANHQRAAEEIGNLGRVDLFRAVCTILTDRDQVFSRSRALA